MIGTNHGKITKIHAEGEKNFRKNFAHCALLDWKNIFSSSRSGKNIFPVEVLVLYFIS